MPTPTPIKSLYTKLKNDLKLPEAYVRKTLLPSWWDDAAASTPAGLAEARLFIARHAGIELGSLVDPSATASFRSDPAKTKYKLPKNRESENVGVARSLAEQAARFAALGARAPFAEARLTSGKEVRAAILASGAPWVSLDSLVSFCWSIGIPVLFLSGELPKGHTKMHGLAARVGNRPVIVVSKKGHPAAMLFVVAHELGHIAHGHISPDSVLIDGTIDEQSDDREEKEANEWACELLLGDSAIGFYASRQWPKATALAAYAKGTGASMKVDPGHIALNYAYTMCRHKPGADARAFWASATAALKSLGGEQDGGVVITRHLSACLDWDALSESGAEFLERMTGASSGVVS